MPHRDDEAGGAMPPATSSAPRAEPETILVWDRFVRIGHWSLVGLFAMAYATAGELDYLHRVIGYALAILIAARLVWGVIGPQYARFSDFVRSPRNVLAYVRSVRERRASRYLGHNPAGGAMVVALLVMLTGICSSGIMMTTKAFWDAAWIETVHVALTDVTLFLIVLHVIGNVDTSLSTGENLVRSMITGRKRV